METEKCKECGTKVEVCPYCGKVVKVVYKKGCDPYPPYPIYPQFYYPGMIWHELPSTNVTYNT